MAKVALAGVSKMQPSDLSQMEKSLAGPPKSIASTDQIADRNAVNAHPEVRGKSSHIAYGKGSAGTDGIDVGHR